MASGTEISARLNAAQRQLRRTGRHVSIRVQAEGRYALAAVRGGMLAPAPPRGYLRIMRGLARYGTFGMLGYLGAAMSPTAPAIIDELGEVSFAELNGRANALANAWRELGFKPGDRVVIMCRNHRGFIEAAYAAARCGGQMILMNTGFSAPQVKVVAEREGADLVIYDEEFEACVADLTPRFGAYRSWCDTRADAPHTTQALIAAGSRRDPPRPGLPPRVIVLTSGTTGKPKGAGRDVPFSLSPIGGALVSVPFKAAEPMLIGAPMFHALGFTQLLLAGALHSTIVLRRRSDASELLAAMADHRVTAAVLVPVVLQRLVTLPPEELAAHDTSALRILYVSGSQLTSTLAARTKAVFGDVLYNVYGSTEIAYGTIASPADLDAAPGTVGRVVPGSSVAIVGYDDHELPQGETGRIFVRNLLKFEGYTGGADKPRFHGKVSSGDIGHFDAEGRLFIDGREDEMIISGGENVFPVELEEVLAAHPEVVDVAVVGVPDADFGARLKAYVVRAAGSELEADTVKQYVRENLARYKVPRDVEFLDELPRNSTGKVLKRQLRAQEDPSQAPA